MELADNLLFTYRPMSQMLRLCVVPEIQRRVACGSIDPGSLPLSVYQFRVLQDGTRNVIEINDELRVVVRARVKRPITAGEDVRLGDIYADQCYIPQPRLEGRPVAYYLCISTYLNFTVFFDFTPNSPHCNAGPDDQEPGLQFPFVDQLNDRQILRQLVPGNAFKRLADLSWPPSPAYYPAVLQRVSQVDVDDKGLFDSVASVLTRQYWDERTKLWEEAALIPDRLGYVSKVIDAYFGGDYVAAIYILTPHFEGIVRDYLRSCGVNPEYRFQSCLQQLRERVYSHAVMMFPREVLEAILEFMQTGTFLTKTALVNDPSRQVNRHGIAHGSFTGFETREITLKYLALLDGLISVLLHDRIVAGTL